MLTLIAITKPKSTSRFNGTISSLKQSLSIKGRRNWAQKTLVLALGLLAIGAPTAIADEITEKFEKHSRNETAARIDHTPFTRLLRAHVRPDQNGLNRVDYRQLKNARTTLRSYIKSLAAFRVTSLERPDQFAYWVNLYNAVTLDVVLDAYPVKSIRDIDISPGLFSNGPWGKKLVTVEGTPLSLDDIEHKILRPVFKDPRVHYAVNCASIGCPNLQQQAFRPRDLEAQLEEAARAFINSPRGVKLQAGQIRASKIYSWFKQDFGEDENEILNHLNKYAAPELKAKLKTATTIDSYFYDWTLNDAKK